MTATSAPFTLTHLRPPQLRPKTTPSISLFLSREASNSRRAIFSCNAAPRKSISFKSSQPPVPDEDENVRLALQSVLWTAEGVYILWLFLLPYAPALFGSIFFEPKAASRKQSGSANL